MISDILIYRAAQLERAFDILRATIDLRFPPDEAVDQKLKDLELEVKLFNIQVNKEKA